MAQHVKTVVLFSNFRPDIGGGGVILRTQIARLQGWKVLWAYLGDGACDYKEVPTECLGAPFVGGALIADLVRSPFLWSGCLRRPVVELAQRLAAFEPDVFWIVAMNEGTLVVPELKRLTNRPVHVSVQDDQEKGMFGRMARYWWMARLARTPLARALRHSDSVDVVSEGMRRYYEAEFAVSSRVTHLIMDSFQARGRIVEVDGVIKIGHIGTLYDEGVGIQFGRALRAFARKSEKRVKWRMIGLAPKFRRLRTLYPDLIEDLGNMPESAAVDLLQDCDVVYAMYPFASNAKVFRQTSFPTKLSTYLQCGRPILAHTPEDSTLAQFVDEYKLGMVCRSLNVDAIVQDLDAACRLEIPSDRFATAAKVAFGPANSKVIQDSLDLLINRKK